MFIWSSCGEVKQWRVSTISVSGTEIPFFVWLTHLSQQIENVPRTFEEKDKPRLAVFCDDTCFLIFVLSFYLA